MSRFGACVACLVAWSLGVATPTYAQTHRVGDAEARASSLDARLDALRGRVSDGALISLGELTSIARSRSVIREGAAREWLDRAERYLAQLEAGGDPFVGEARGEIALRAYHSEISERPQRYAVYVPPDYDPDRRYPLLIALHGGSSNGNLFCALVMGARVPWSQYRQNWDRVHAPLRTPQWIVVAPDGFGNSMWRYLGERDVLDVLDDVQRHYAIDPDRIVLSGLSNGGLGAFNIGARHAWRFAGIEPMAGAPGWTHYLGVRTTETLSRILEPQSGWALFANARNTMFHAHHGRRDPGPMRPRYMDELTEHAHDVHSPFELTWYPTGHDLVGPVHRDGQFFARWEGRRREPRPARVTLLTGDYRAARQHWVEVTRIDDYPSIARVDAESQPERVTVLSRGASALRLLLDETPHAARPRNLWVNGQLVSTHLSGAQTVVRRGGRWELGAPGPEGKRPGLSGPLPDASWGRVVHVYGTRDPAHTEALRAAAEAGARGWIGNLRTVWQGVLADHEVTPEILRSAHIAVYGSSEDNALIASVAAQLPIRIERDGIWVGEDRYPGAHLGVRFIFPNPLAPDRYLVVQAAADPAAVLAGDRLAAFLPDWIVYDANRLPEERTNIPMGGLVAQGFFNDRWELPITSPVPEEVPLAAL